MSEADILNILDSSEPVNGNSNPPIPIIKEYKSSDVYPVNCFQDDLKEAIEAVVDLVQCPIGIASQSIISTVCLVTQHHRNIIIPDRDLSRPMSCFFLTIGDSGERKTTCDTYASAGIKKYEQKLQGLYEEKLTDYKNRKDLWESEKKEIFKEKKVSKEEKESRLKELGSSPVLPMEPLITIPDITYEGIINFLQNSHCSVGIYSDEGGSLIGGYSMGKEHKVKMNAGLSSLWDKGGATKITKGEGSTIISNKRLSMHIMAQPSIMQEWVGDEKIENQGIFSRIIFCYPESKIGTRFYKAPNQNSLDIIGSFQQKTMELIEMKEKLDPSKLFLETKAKSLWIDFLNKIEREMGEGERLACVRNFVNKSPELAIRLAGNLAIFNNAEAQEIKEESLYTAIEIIGYSINETLRMKELWRVSRETLNAQKLLNWLLYEWNECYISIPDIQQMSPIRDNEYLKKKIIPILLEHNYLIQIKEDVLIKNQKRKNVFQINKL